MPQLGQCILAPEMNTKQKRPVGITLLSIAFLYIGGLGTIFLPIIGFFAGSKMLPLWRIIAGGVIHSEALLRISGYLILSIWYLLYVAYAVIGFGLWKLHRWAHRAILTLTEFGTAVSLLALPFFVRPWSMAVAIGAGTSIPFAWTIWYLKRPRVRFAFGAWPSDGDGDATAEPPPGLSKMGKIWGIASIVATLVLFCCCLMASIESTFRSSEIYQMGLKQAQDSPCSVSIFGTPLTPERGIQGSLETSGSKGSAELEIPVHGPKGKGSLEVSGKKQGGVWKITSLVLVQGSKQFQITPEDPSSVCQ